MANTITLSQIRQQIRERADLVDDPFFSDSELNSYINSSYAHLYNLLVKTNQDYYLTESLPFNLIPGQETYNLPSDFFKLVGVDAFVDSKWRPLKRFVFNERNRTGILRYMVSGDKIRFKPVPESTHEIKLYYIPVYSKLTSDASTLDGLNGFEEYIIWDCIIKCKNKTEEDASIALNERNLIEMKIRDIASERDSGSPAYVADVQDFYLDEYLGLGDD